jgi:zinc transporter ZupT
LLAAVSTPLGALVAYPFIRSLDEALLGILLAVSAGALVYVGATHLLPRVEEEHRRYTTLTMLGGALVGILIILSKGGLT